MAEIIKSIEDIENLFRQVVLTILGLDSKKNPNRVRFPWGSNLKAGISSAPASIREKDVCYIYALPQDDTYNRQRDRYCIDNGGRDLIEVDEHTDVHFLNFANYGPNAYECARDIRDGLFRRNIRRILKQNHFALVTDVPAIRRIPEKIDNEWCNRVDFSAVFNEFVRRESTMPVIEEISIKALEIGRTGLIAEGKTIERNKL